MKNLQLNNFMMAQPNSEIMVKGANSRNKGQFSGITKTTGHSLAPPRNSYQILNLDNFLG